MEEKRISNEGLTEIFHIMKEDYVTVDNVREVVLKQKQGVDFLKRNTYYNVGDCVYHDNLKNGLFLECIESGMTGDVEPTI